ncbi:MAG TPA: TonB-dependent receptor, partial [Rheinheimera sp.]|nr:TonB-dependent receptor [Rheinheimera sp.]
YTNAKRDEERDLSQPGSGLVEGTSRHMANASVYYETDKLSARLMYNYRTEWYKGLHFNGDELWNDSYGQLDASFGYNISENITLSFEAVNLTDEEVVEYNTDTARLFSIYQNGRRFVAGVRMNF